MLSTHHDARLQHLRMAQGTLDNESTSCIAQSFMPQNFRRGWRSIRSKAQGSHSRSAAKSSAPIDGAGAEARRHDGEKRRLDTRTEARLEARLMTANFVVCDSVTRLAENPTARVRYVRLSRYLRFTRTAPEVAGGPLRRGKLEFPKSSGHKALCLMVERSRVRQGEARRG